MAPLSEGSVPTLESGTAAVEALRGLLPGLRARAARTDAERRIPDETIDELAGAGLFGLLTPKRFGGSELGLAALVDVTAEIAAVCGSSAWVYGVLAGHSWLLNLFPAEAQAEIYADPRALTATLFRLGGVIRRVPGGYHLDRGEGRFCSGIDHARWIIVGNQVVGESQAPEPRFFVLPRSAVSEIVDDWYVAGMRGTGSKTVRFGETFIPEHRSVRAEDMARGTTPGALLHGSPLYRMSWQHISPFSLVGVPLGLGRAAVSAFGALLSRQMEGFAPERQAEQSATFARLGLAAADVDAAYSTVVESARRIDAAADPAALSPLQLARIPRDWAYAAQKCRGAVTSLFEAAGGTAIYDSSDMQRIWRDANASANHFAFTLDAALASFGRAAASLPPSKFGPKGR
jgi:3-hydroxy-9,10-secoandrosta-1,3,5(10)-triene-9,17-dione monooxygenase